MGGRRLICHPHSSRYSTIFARVFLGRNPVAFRRPRIETAQPTAPEQIWGYLFETSRDDHGHYSAIQLLKRKTAPAAHIASAVRRTCASRRAGIQGVFIGIGCSGRAVEKESLVATAATGPLGTGAVSQLRYQEGASRPGRRS